MLRKLFGDISIRQLLLLYIIKLIEPYGYEAD